MGCYINPPNEKKESFLFREGSLTIPTWPVNSDLVLVCLVDNKIFSAAGVCFDGEEFNRFNDPNDPRKKLWFLVPINRIQGVISDPECYLPKLLNKEKNNE